MSMKGHQLLFENSIDINPRTGTIMLHDKRMVLMSVEALGILRRDLIDTIGEERTKGFLMRYGWACGYRDGGTMEEKYAWESKKELLLSGPALHTLEGIVTVDPDIIEIEEDRLYFAGYWRNSFEADEHIAHYGESDQCVCWMLIGYASGFLTRTFGKDVIAYEKYCRGKGDPHCYFVAKTVDELDERHLKDLQYYQTESLQSTLDQVYLEIQQLNEDIIESEKVQNQLTDLLLEDKDIDDTTELIGNTLKRSIIIDHFNEIHSSSLYNEEDRVVYEKWIKSRVATTQQDNKWIETFNIKSHHLLLGRMVIIGEEKLNKREKMIIKRALMVFTIQMFHQRKISESKWKKKEDFFDEIIKNKELDEVSLKRHARLFDFNVNETNQIIAIKISPKEMTEDVLNFLTMKYSNLDIFSKENYIVMILSESYTDDIENFISTIVKAINKKIAKAKVYAGSGRKAEKISLLRKSYHDATRICDFVQLTYPMDSRYATFEEFEPIILFLKGTDQEELISFYHNTIGKLVDYDIENKGTLVITLKSYLDNNGNLQQTAKDLHLSIAGLRYRIERIESLCDIDLKTGAGRFKCQLATRIYFVLKVMNN